MKFLFDLFPIILFFTTYQLYPLWGPKSEAIYYATAVAIAATVGQIAWVYFRRGKVDKMLWISFALISVFGGATLLFHDKTFIMWKPSILYWLFSATLFVSAKFFDKNIIKTMLQEQLQVPEPIWQKLNGSWSLFFLLLGFANCYVAFTFSEATWVKFKMFGTFGLMLLFILLQSMLLAKYVPEKEENTL